MSLLAYLRRRGSLLAELEAARAENAALREQLETARLVSWIRRTPSPVPRRLEPHPVHAGRHARAEPTEIYARRFLR